MKNIEKQVTITNKTEISFNAYLSAVYASNCATLKIDGDQLNTITAIGVDFWDGLIKLRQQLEPLICLYNAGVWQKMCIHQV